MLALTLLDISVRLDELRRPPDLPRPGVLATRLPLYRPPVQPAAGQEKPIEPRAEAVLSADGHPCRAHAVGADEDKLRT